MSMSVFPGERPDRMEEECGVFGIYAPGEDVARMTCFGLQALQHRGQESAGHCRWRWRHHHGFQGSGLGDPGIYRR